ncbi:arsenate reductase/protein-tyrosine-phosphatase family protein [Jeotgalibacillus terrae]|uniref:Phosphotyrosine protein phosphatase I domain-containing protein n=1 Tax=Jeotgalibacillus terrae TaxID=587735 RepID=A0ABW5ZD60_9BACL|nr:hypothetical protein [Jeotgalibacillus terrae]MBM7580837.1 protein-tyrosine-phosphatase [Jeotgalibacillus terrae]
MADRYIYFISANHERSSIAEGWASRLYIPGTVFKSAGWTDARKNPFTLQAMQEISIDIASITPYRISESDLRNADVIVLIQDPEIDEEISIHPSFSDKVINWNIVNPAKRATDPFTKWAMFQEICDEIALKIRELEKDLSASAV